MSDYYKLLDVEKTATTDEIKKAYRKMALKWHPDKNPQNKEEARKKFQEISEACSVLTDPEKRKQYDMYGKVDTNGNFSGFSNAGSGGTHYYSNVPFNAEDFFRSFVDASNVFETYENDTSTGHTFSFGIPRTKSFKHSIPRTKHTINHDLYCTLEELYNGTKKKIKVKEKIIELEVYPGWKEGTKITLDEEFPDIEIIVMIKETPHNKFKRVDGNLYVSMTISLEEALNGFNKNISLLDGSIETIKLKGIKSSDYIHLIKNKGMPIRKNGKNVGKGDLHVNFIVKFT